MISKLLPPEVAHFNPLPPHGGRRSCQVIHGGDNVNFNPLPPHGGRPLSAALTSKSMRAFQSTPSAWRETDASKIGSTVVIISIHSLRMEGDTSWRTRSCFIRDFNPLPPHGGRRPPSAARCSAGSFQSTPSAWRETCKEIREALPKNTFQSTPSAWRETEAFECADSEAFISIHSLRMEGDPEPDHMVSALLHFNPLPPHGGRRVPCVSISPHKNFNPLPPHGGRLGEAARPVHLVLISIHSLRMEGDGVRKKVLPCPLYFNPLPPHGGRLPSFTFGISFCAFQSTPSAWRETHPSSFQPA